MLEIYDLKTEYLNNPVAIDVKNPRFSWKLRSDGRGVMQKSYHIIAVCDGRVIWDSGVFISGDTQRVHYSGQALVSRQQVSWNVSIVASDEDGNEERATGGPVSFSIGLLEPSDWLCKWIEPENDVDIDARKPAPILRKSFKVDGKLAKAMIYQTAHGLYEFYINGKTPTEDKFKPGFTSYYHRIQYQVYNITGCLNEGENIWGVVLGDGWWRGSTGGTLMNNFGYKLHFFGQIELYYMDGRRETVITDDGFKASTGGLLASDMMMGDIYDSRLEPGGWKEAAYNDSEWDYVHFSNENKLTELIASRSVPVREKEKFKPVVFTDTNGKTILDFSQNIAGYVSFILRDCTEGQIVKLSFGETLINGAFSQANISKTPLNAQVFQEITYTCSGMEIEEYTPIFSVFGFRYVMLEGYAGDVESSFVAKAVYSDMEKTGSFTCSNELINKLVENSLWSQKSNYLDVATDCPTRERNPWTGDNQIYVSTAAYFMDVYSFYEKWLQDMSLEQYQSGRLGLTFPSASSCHNKEEYERLLSVGKQTGFLAMAGPGGDGNLMEGSVGWCDAAVRLPYIIYKHYGDINILRNQYPTAKKWVDYMIDCAKKPNSEYVDTPQYRNGNGSDAEFLFDTGMHFGEWLEPIESENSGITDIGMVFALMAKKGNPLVASAYMRRSCTELAEMASALGLSEDSRYYFDISDKVSEVYSKYFIGDDGTIEPGHQAAYVRAIAFDLCSEEKKSKVLNKLVEEIERNAFRPNTGFLSTPFLLPALSDNGYTDIAFMILEQTECPGWLFSVLNGSTTIPENWDGFVSKKSSLNHYSYGAVCEFLFNRVAGIKPLFAKPGYKEFEIAPIVDGSFTCVKCVYESLYGEIVSEWGMSEGKVRFFFSIPVNTTARIVLPDGRNVTVGSGEYYYEYQNNELGHTQCKPRLNAPEILRDADKGHVAP